MENGKSPTLAETIPGWRVMRSDAGRLWATRDKPFPDAVTKGSLYTPPFRTVDADTFEALQREVEHQERAADQGGQVTS
ncbi:hypothetical protein AB0395_27395 [Streptosporangium sp. NPDC051023]|uniref:hypothetical protein n=1 Tax=Streptosporangium sp. NPDC051023 TaxID=3155410 RepID=UPI00344B3240